MIRATLMVAFCASLFLALPSAWAVDRQGKQTLEQYRSRPKENRPPTSGADRVQDQTRTRTEKTLGRSQRQQEATSKRARGVLNKR
jgi:hypothetical protein